MKRTYSASVLMVLAALMAASCADNNETEVLGQESISLTGEIGQIPVTRTQIDIEPTADGSVGILWSVGDRVGVFGNTTPNAPFDGTFSTPVSSGEFKGSLYTDDRPRFAYYPYVEVATDSRAIPVNVASVQYYTDEASIAANDVKASDTPVKKDGGYGFIFKPLVSFLKAEVTFGSKLDEVASSERLQSIIFRQKVEGIAVPRAWTGDFTMNLTNLASGLAAVDGKTSSQITVKLAKNEEGGISVGRKAVVYAAIAPGIKKGDEIVYMQGLHRKKDDYKADGKGLLQDIALTVLINESTASSSEIFAGAMQDNDRGLIIGRRSFGKGLVQEPVYFNDGSGVRLTVARFYTPSGRCIQKPYSEDYQYDIYKRYADGEMYDADSIKVDSTAAYKTVAGRTVYGGGGIITHEFVPVDTTRATKFYIACNKKATQMRFASAMFDKYKSRLSEIDSDAELGIFLDRMNIPSAFREYASSKDGITCTQKEWEETSEYLLPQLRALVGRYSKLGENAFYKMYLNVDVTLKKAIESDSRNLLHPAR